MYHYRLFFSLLLLTLTTINFANAQSGDYRKKRKREPKFEIKDTTKILETKSSLLDMRPGSIIGQIIDKSTGEPLTGVAITIVGEGKGTVSDLDGNFTFRDLKPISYILECHLISYHEEKITEVKVTPNATVRLKIPMLSSDIVINEVVIEGRMSETSDAALVDIQRNSIQISDGFSGDMILKETPDFQVSTVLRRMPGMALIEDRYLVLRGLFERHNLATINGAILPVTDIERSGFDFNMIPSNLISSVRIVKTATPDINSEFSGGIIQLETADIPESNSIRISGQAMYNTGSTFKKVLQYPYDNKRLWLFQEVNEFHKNLESPNTINSQDPYSEIRLQNAKTLPRKIYNDTVLVPIGTNLNFNIQRHGKIAGQEVGISAFVNYLSHTQRRDFILNIVRKYDPNTLSSPVNDTSDSRNYNNYRLLCSMVNVGLRLDTKGKIAWKNILYYSTDNFSGEAYGQYINEDDTTGGWTNYFFTNSRFTGTLMYSTQLIGAYKFQNRFKKEIINLHVQANYTTMFNKIPVYRAGNYALANNGQYYYEAYAGVYGQIFGGNQVASVMGGQIHLESPHFHRVLNLKIKAGGYANVRTRQFYSRLAGHYFVFDEEDNPIDSLSEATKSLSNIKNIHNDANIGVGGFTINDSTNSFNNFNSISQNYASYLLFDFRIARKFRAYFGGRFEYFQQTIDTIFENKGQYYDNTRIDILPSASLVFTPTDKSNLRLAFAQTLIRPNDRELTPLAFLNYEYGIYTKGNPSLTRSKSTNIDIRFEYFPSGTELMSLSLFTKWIDKPIEQEITDGSIDSYQIYDYTNTKNAALVGIELELRRNLGKMFHVKYLENLIFYGNLSLMRSRVAIENPIKVFEKEGREMQGQASMLLNVGIIFTEPISKISIAAFYNRVGRRVALVGVGDTIFPSFFELPRNVIDIQIARSFFKSKLEIRLAGADLLNQPYRWVQMYEGRNKYIENKDRLIRSTQLSRNFYLTISYKF